MQPHMPLAPWDCVCGGVGDGGGGGRKEVWAGGGGVDEGLGGDGISTNGGWVVEVSSLSE